VREARSIDLVRRLHAFLLEGSGRGFLECGGSTPLSLALA